MYMFRWMCRARAASAYGRRWCSGRGKPEMDGPGPLRRLVDEASAFGEAAPSDGPLRWATQPYAAAPGSERPAPAPADATVLLFPGQGTHYVGMGARFKDVPAARDLYHLASEILGWDVWRVCSEGPAEELSRRAQVAVCVSALAALEAARELRPAAVQRVRAAAGFSLGEFAALVFAGALSLEAALRVIEVRAAAMEACCAERPGGLLTVWLEPDAKPSRLLAMARDVAAEAGVESPVCSIANYMYAGCRVIGGDEAALRWIEREGRAHRVKRAARVAVPGAYHTALMDGTRAPVRAALRAVEVRAPALTVWSCAEARPYRDAADVSRGLARLAALPVRWEQTLHGLLARPRDTPPPLTLALGPGRALRATLRQVNARAWDASLQIDT